MILVVINKNLRASFARAKFLAVAQNIFCGDYAAQPDHLISGLKTPLYFLETLVSESASRNRSVLDTFASR